MTPEYPRSPRLAYEMGFRDGVREGRLEVERIAYEDAAKMADAGNEEGKHLEAVGEYIRGWRSACLNLAAAIRSRKP